MIILFWDIDGTLLTTGKAGVPAWETAVREITGRDFQLSAIRIAGLSDYLIAVSVFELLGIDASAEQIDRLVQRYESLLDVTLPQRQGRVLPNVREILEQAASRPDVRSYLLTGNTRGGARAKLAHYGLWKYFPDGAFAEDTGERASIAARAVELARRSGPISDERLIVIGDTPHDVHAANAIGALTIAVATGGYSREELEPHGPWRVFDELPEPGEFLQLIDTALTEPSATPAR
jgi:phosphoglycolate phosphatase-like HAD superfamily hydrolase